MSYAIAMIAAECMVLWGLCQLIGWFTTPARPTDAEIESVVAEVLSRD